MANTSSSFSSQNKANNNNNNTLVAEDDAKMLKLLELCVTFGKWMIVEGVVNDRPFPILQPGLTPEITVNKSDGQACLTVGDKFITYNSNFRLFLSCPQANPKFSPNIYIQTAPINFELTVQGLEDQLLSIVVAIENPKIEVLKAEQELQFQRDQMQLRQIEDEILRTISGYYC